MVLSVVLCGFGSPGFLIFSSLFLHRTLRPCLLVHWHRAFVTFFRMRTDLDRNIHPANVCVEKERAVVGVAAVAVASI